MKQTFNNAAKRTALAVAAVLASLTGGIAQAATFASVDFSIATRTSEAQEVAAGDLLCSWRETGLGPYQVVTYNCAAGAVAAVQACVYKGKIISTTETVVAQNLSSQGEHGEGEAFIANNSGRISGSTAIAIPEGGEGGEELCPEIGETGGPQPEVEVVAVRWCNVSLTDSLGTSGGTQTELFAQLVRGTFTVPSCSEILPAAAQ